MSAQLNILSWNARGIVSLEGLAQLRDAAERLKPDLFLIQETFLSKNNKLFIPNYRAFRRDRESHGGGVLILVNKSIPAIREPDLDTPAIEAIGVVIKVGNEDWTIRCVYIPRYKPGLADDLQKALSGERVMCMGDWNARHPDWDGTPNKIGRTPYRTMECQYSMVALIHIIIHKTRHPV